MKKIFFLLWLFVPSIALANTATLTWPPIVNAVSYNIYKSTISGMYSTTAFANVLDTHRDQMGNVFFVDTVPNDKNYYYVVRSVSTAGESANSNEVVARPLIPAPPNVTITTVATIAFLGVKGSTVASAPIGTSILYNYVVQKSNKPQTLALSVIYGGQ